MSGYSGLKKGFNNMERQPLLELLRLIIIAFFIALVINLLRVLAFDNLRTNAENNLISQIEQFFTHDNNSSNDIAIYEEQSTQPIRLNNETDSDVIGIPVEPMKDFSGMTRDDILELRTEAVRTSPIHWIDGYLPNLQIFRIENRLPWITARITCFGGYNDGNMNAGIGVSNASVGILNPELLLYVSVPPFNFSKYGYSCSEEDYMLPYKITYDKNTKTISAYIKFHSLKEKHIDTIYLHDANANDLGFHYAAVDSMYNIKENAFTSNTHSINGYYTHGYACGLPGGCNNLAPPQPYYKVEIKDLPAEFNMKLWKENPFGNINKTADINYRMVFE